MVAVLIIAAYYIITNPVIMGKYSKLLFDQPYHRHTLLVEVYITISV